MASLERIHVDGVDRTPTADEVAAYEVAMAQIAIETNTDAQ